MRRFVRSRWIPQSAQRCRRATDLQAKGERQGEVIASDQTLDPLRLGAIGERHHFSVRRGCNNQRWLLLRGVLIYCSIANHPQNLEA